MRNVSAEASGDSFAVQSLRSLDPNARCEREEEGPRRQWLEGCVILALEENAVKGQDDFGAHVENSLQCAPKAGCYGSVITYCSVDHRFRSSPSHLIG